MKVLALLFISVVSGLACAGAEAITSDIPLPNTYDGFLYPSRGAKAIGGGKGSVVVEAFFDLLCSDCKAAWPTVKLLMNEYEHNSTKAAPALILHTFPLPYHHNAFYANQGAHVLNYYAEEARKKGHDYPADGKCSSPCLGVKPQDTSNRRSVSNFCDSSAMGSIAQRSSNM